jgi:hypothetical protein
LAYGPQGAAIGEGPANRFEESSGYLGCLGTVRADVPVRRLYDFCGRCLSGQCCLRNRREWRTAVQRHLQFDYLDESSIRELLRVYDRSNRRGRVGARTRHALIARSRSRRTRFLAPQAVTGSAPNRPRSGGACRLWHWQFVEKRSRSGKPELGANTRAVSYRERPVNQRLGISAGATVRPSTPLCLTESARNPLPRSSSSVAFTSCNRSVRLSGTAIVCGTP